MKSGIKKTILFVVISFVLIGLLSVKVLAEEPPVAEPITTDTPQPNEPVVDTTEQPQEQVEPVENSGSETKANSGDIIEIKDENGNTITAQIIEGYDYFKDKILPPLISIFTSIVTFVLAVISLIKPLKGAKFSLEDATKLTKSTEASLKKVEELIAEMEKMSNTIKEQKETIDKIETIVTLQVQNTEEMVRRGVATKINELDKEKV